MAGSDSEMSTASGHSRSNLQVVRAPANENDEMDDSQGGRTPARAGTSQDTQSQQTQLRAQISELIEECQQLQDVDTSVNPEVQENLKHNFQAGFEIFKSNVRGETGGEVAAASGSRRHPDMHGGRKRIIAGPGDMYMFSLHSKVITQTILTRAERIGSSSSGFSVDLFLQKLVERFSRNGSFEMNRNKMFDKDGPKSLYKCILKGSKILPSMVCLVGSFDRDALLQAPPVREKKLRATPRKRLVDTGDEEATRHEEVQYSDIQKHDNAEAKSKALLEKLKSKQKKKKKSEPVSLFELAVGPSVPQTAENLLHAAFLARDGYVSVKRSRKRKKGRKLDSDLVLNPEKPPTKEPGKADPNVSRHQHIVSFNARTYQAMVAALKSASLM